jgi:hypothetical protein
MTSTSPHIINTIPETSQGQISINVNDLSELIKDILYISSGVDDIDLITIFDITANNNSLLTGNGNDLIQVPTNTNIKISISYDIEDQPPVNEEVFIIYVPPAAEPTGPDATAIVEAKRVELTDYLSSDYVNLSGYNAVSKQQVEYIRNTLSVEIMNAETDLLLGINTLSGIVMTLSGDLSERIDYLSGEVKTLSGALSERIDTLSGEVIALSGALSTRIDTLSGEVIALSGALSTRIDTLSGDLISGLNDMKVYVDDKFQFLISNTSPAIDSINDLLSNATQTIDSINDIMQIINDLETGDVANIMNNINTLSNQLETVKVDYFSKAGGTVSGNTFFVSGGNTTLDIDVVENKVKASNVTVSGYFYMNNKWRMKLADNGTELRFEYSNDQFNNNGYDKFLRFKNE